MANLIDIDYLRRQPLGIKGFDNIPAEVVEEFISEASEYVEDYCDRNFTSTVYVERIVGSGRYTLILDQYPVLSVSDVSYEGYSEQGTHSTLDFLIHSESGIIEWKDKRYNFRSDRIYKVTYNAGYTEVPGPVKRATALQVVQLMRPMYGGAASEVEVVPFADELIISLLEKYRRKRLS